jgi:sialate O-acetylesterase
MVLQQQSNVPIWGWSTPGESISVSCNWSKQKVTVNADDSGKWKAMVATPKAGGPYTINITGKSNSISIEDVLIGEVWVCSGQSNMVLSFSNSNTYKEDLNKMNYPNIRYMEVNRQVSETSLDDAPGSVWKAITPGTSKKYSAAALYFAIKLQKEMKVPVGIIEAAWGGTAIDNWMPADALKNDKPLERWEDWKKEFKGDSLGYYTTLAAYKKKEISKKPEMPSSVYINLRRHRMPSGLYNGLIAPITQFKIKGVLWYQGETNRKWSSEYANHFNKMITSWRDAWHSDFPFYFVQLAPFKGDAQGVSEIMEAQFEVMKTTKNVGMVVTMDVGNMDDIHPKDKKPVGERLANWALSKTYGFKNINYTGPLYEGFTRENNKIKLLFDYALSGLEAQGKLNGFEVVEFNDNGTEKSPRPLQVKIDGTKLVVSTENLELPVIIRYGWGINMANANLFNGEGLPASPFRTLVK